MYKFKYWLEDNLLTIMLVVVLVLGTYSLVGTDGNVEKIKELAPQHMTERNWKIVRYEGWQRGSWMSSGGKVWYHVANIDNPTIQYRVYITMWGGELMYTYGEPEVLQRIEVISK